MSAVVSGRAPHVDMLAGMDTVITHLRFFFVNIGIHLKETLGKSLTTTLAAV